MRTLGDLMRDGGDVEEQVCGLWVRIASFGTPREVCNLEQICRSLNRAMHSASKGQGLLQKYWHVQCQRLRWEPETEQGLKADAAPVHPDATKRALLQHSLTKPESKRNWKQSFREEYEAFQRRNLRGVGVKNRAVERRIGPEITLNADRPPVATSAAVATTLSSSVDVDELLEARARQGGDADFVRMCVDGGLSVEHFTRQHGVASIGDERKKAPGQSSSSSCEVLAPSRIDYHKNPRLGKRQGKHANGKEGNVWSQWASHDDYEY